jgi:hypothetical protein
MLALDHLRLLDNVSIPPGLYIKVTDSTDEFLTLKTQLNSAAATLFGTAYRQGNRLHFASAMSVGDYANLTRVEHAAKGSTLDEMREMANRPKEPAHGKNIAKYLAETACVGKPFILPSCIVNYGLGWHEDMPKAELTIFAGARESMVWPAIFVPPTGSLLPVTDGGHRTDEIDGKIKSGSAGRLTENAISVIFVMEDDWVAYHQDFADCAKSKAMAKSLTASWDKREAGNRFAQDLLGANPTLQKLVDSTSNSVNLSGNSAKAWSMSALASATAGVYGGESDPKRLSSFFDLLFAKVPIMIDVANGGSPAKHRQEPRGGCVLLRGVGIAVLTQAFLHAVESGSSLADMADAMAKVDWHVLKPGAPNQNGIDAATYTKQWAQPVWLGTLAMMAGDVNFRIKGNKKSAEDSFAMIAAQLNL